MCHDHAALSDNTVGKLLLSRRALLQAAAITTASAGAFGRSVWAPTPAAASVDGAYSMAMHIHSSFSELSGSMDGHLQQAAANNVDVIWWTDHDTKMNGVNDRRVVHFTSLTNEAGDGTPWTWTLERNGSLTSASTGGVVRKPASPRDPIAPGSLHVSAQGTDTNEATLGFHPVAEGGHHDWRTNLTAQKLYLEVLPTAVSPDSYLELRVTSSYHPAIGGRSAGEYTLSYRFKVAPRPVREAIGRDAVITVPCLPGEWNSVTLRPDRDLAALFPDLDSRDFSLYEFSLRAVSNRGAPAEGYFDYMRFSRQTTGDVALAVQDDMMSAYRGRYPGVSQHHGLEVSHALPHLNWFGGALALPVYTGVKRADYPDFLRETVVPDIHDAGGLASYNHPYGTNTPRIPLPLPTQDEMLQQVAVELLTNNALGTDILEVGYPLRAGVDIDHHTGLWDVCSRNALFLTGNGVTDDHLGEDWTAHNNDWTTTAWADTTEEAALLDSLRSGRVWCGSLSQPSGALDLLVDGQCPMGSVSVSQRSTRNLTVTATSVPSGGSVDLVQGVVDYAGPERPAPATEVVGNLSAAALSRGTVDVAVDTSEPSFVRTQVRDSRGTVIALSNPVWLLRAAPPGGRAIPAARAC